MNQVVDRKPAFYDVRSEPPSEASGKIGKGQPSAFVQKLYQMIECSDPNIASWTQDGTMFVVKDPQMFERKVIPKYFAHSKFTSFARQLNFYCFNKIHFKPIRNVDFDPEADKRITYHHVNFRRGRPDLLIHIKRPSKKLTSEEDQANAQEIQILKDRVESLEAIVSTMFAERNAVKSLLELPSQTYGAGGSSPADARSATIDVVHSSAGHHQQQPQIASKQGGIHCGTANQPQSRPQISSLRQDEGSGKAKYANIGNIIQSLPFV